jgi:hypothetical protein
MVRKLESVGSLFLKAVRESPDREERPESFEIVVIAVAGRMNQRQQDVIEYLREENRVLRVQLGKRCLRLPMINVVVSPFVARG